MKTKELIVHLKDIDLDLARNGYLVTGIKRVSINEVIQKLREHDELKRLIYETIDPLDELFHFLFFTIDDDSEGSIEGCMEDK